MSSVMAEKSSLANTAPTSYNIGRGADMRDFSRRAYYADQTGWEKEDFLQLYGYIAKLFLYSDRQENMDEIEQLDIERMSQVARVFIYVVLLHQEKQYFLKMDNLAGLKGTQPLPELLYLVDKPRNVHEVLIKYNIGL